ncbi:MULTISPECIES: hypothetical protein [Streptomyces]|uniref:LPXTG-motif cell wall-anchored protein n=1 Tax=Streptomyces spororaveus TaxID=284039 RepID=A0ABQ3TCH1_9ACTN|nr:MULTISPECIES: hypothetical protein [Streptomyces]MCM9081455.1 hypothetical protein [Streptomyces spororaveus]MCX5304095.1 hypothetical protein [Streptomyces sp. NBC_00160]GHI78114.1 hypothetical protein Sspor_36750 [Streptomyces spororaveus]
MSARRPLLTALGATTLLAALWFVPSAGATSAGTEETGSGVPAGANAAGTATGGSDAGPDAPGTVTGTASGPASRPQSLLADTGSVDTTPYLLGGTLFLGVGAGFVAFSVRRSHAP